MHYYMVTGTTSGIGEAIARKLLLDNQHVCSISRNINEMLSALAAETSGGFWHIDADLGQPDSIPGVISRAISITGTRPVASMTLVNNAGVLDPVMPAGRYDLMQLKNHLHVNLLAPMILTNEFIRLTNQYVIQRTVVNIGSGASTAPYAGWGPYCSSKAGLEMFTRTTNLEQKTLPNPVRVMYIAPGIVDTKMQVKIRRSNPDNFPMKEKFEQLYQDNLLSLPSHAAEKITGLIYGSIHCDSEVIDLRKL